MLRLAPRELDVVGGVGEVLPLRSRAFPCALLVVTLCFVQDPAAVLREAMRVAERVAACIVPRDSPWGRRYREAAARGHPFYAKAKFYTVKEVVEMAGVAPSRVMATSPTAQMRRRRPWRSLERCRWRKPKRRGSSV
jgi:ubiquinone/menaquinone biosynthesis C-methylase UbiE